jgi:hypothetical protein
MEIKSSRLTTCDVTRDGEVIRLNLIDAAGGPVSLRLPFDQAGALAMTLPGLLTRAPQSALWQRDLATSFPSASGQPEGVAVGPISAKLREMIAAAAAAAASPK